MLKSYVSGVAVVEAEVVHFHRQDLSGKMNSLTNCEYRTCFFVFAGCGETACPVSKDILPHDFKRIPSDVPRGEYFSVYIQINIVT